MPVRFQFRLMVFGGRNFIAANNVPPHFSRRSAGPGGSFSSGTLDKSGGSPFAATGSIVNQSLLTQGPVPLVARPGTTFAEDPRMYSNRPRIEIIEDKPL